MMKKTKGRLLREHGLIMAQKAKRGLGENWELQRAKLSIEDKI